jgi:hypothetical protein
MPRPDTKIHRVGFEKAVAHLTPDCELFRATGWSRDVDSEAWHLPLALHVDGRIMAHFDSFTLTVEDVLAKDWEVWRVNHD